MIGLEELYEQVSSNIKYELLVGIEQNKFGNAISIYQRMEIVFVVAVHYRYSMYVEVDPIIGIHL